MKNWFIYLLLILLSLSFESKGQVLMHPNRGQWEKPIDYLVEMDAGYLYIESQGLTYNLFDYHSHHDEFEAQHEEDLKVKQHVVKTHFIGSQKPTRAVESQEEKYYRNYFLGQNPEAWKTSVHSIRQVEYQNIYPDIHLNYVTNEEGLKYSLTVQPHANANQIEIEISGSDEIKINKSGDLAIKTRFGWINESQPLAWTINEKGIKTVVDCKFKLVENHLSFLLTEYDHSQTLIIDPQLTFSTFTGSTSDNWGYTACPDEMGNLFAGGIVFGAGYPITVGSFDTSFNGGDLTGGIPGFDISITKFNATGTQNLFSTYLGGAGNETPNSLVTNQAGDLFILSTTSSIDFPVSPTAFQPAFAGGVPTIQELLFNGSDLAIIRLSADGTTLQGSTYLGGTGNDGLNYGSNLQYNYGDAFRGEIIVDALSNVYFASSTQSNDFPVASATGSLQGFQDAIYGKLSPDLSLVQFCDYFGNEGFETGNALQLSQLNDLYITGGSTSATLNFENGGFQLMPVSATDAYVVRADGMTGAIINGTYLGTDAYDQAYFVQVDLDNNVYVLGQTAGVYPITALYGIPNAKQFIHKLSPDLMNSLWSTTIGSGIAANEISPTAFLVSDCFDIYLSGWGGVINSFYSLASQSSSNGFPITSDAFQATTNGSNFYIAVLARDADSLKYGTYMGGVTSSFNHVDGGTSRFDKDGTIYHAVCGSCGFSTTGFTVTPGVWSPTDLSTNCNLAAFKFNLNTMTATIGNTDQFICYPDPVIFQNYSSFGNQYHWDFGDGTTSTDEDPIHDYATPGNYVVQLIVIDTNNCYFSDTSYIDIVIDEFEGAIIPILTPVCPNIPFQLEASGGYEYHWSPANLLDDSLSATPMATINGPTTFQVIVIDSCGIDTLSILVDVYSIASEIFVDTALCLGDTIPIMVDSSNLQSINWSPAAYFSNPTAFNTSVFITSSQTITADAITLEGCPLELSTFISVDTLIPSVTISDSTICDGQIIDLSSSVTISGGTYSWIGFPEIGPDLSAISPTVNTIYTVVYQLNTCIATDSATVFVNPQPLNLTISDTVICFGSTVLLNAEADVLGGTFTWYEGNSVLSNLNVSPTVGVHYFPTIYTINGCSITDSMRVEVLPQPTTLNLVDTSICDGQNVVLNAQPDYAGGTFSWSPTTETTQSITVSPAVGTTIYSLVYNLNGCVFEDSSSVEVKIQPLALGMNDTTICQGNSIGLLAQPDFIGGNYLWQLNGVTTNTIIVTPALGQHFYSITYDLNGCTIIDSSEVNVLPQPTTLNLVNSIICEDSTLILVANPLLLGGSYYWNHSGETTSQVNVNPTVGTTYYSVIYDLNGCIYADSIEVKTYPYPVLNHQDYSICLGESVQITANPTIPNGTYLWANGNQTTASITVSPSVNTNYAVSYSSNGCATSSQVSVILNALPTGIFMTDSVCQSANLHSEIVLDSLMNDTFAWQINGVIIPNATTSVFDSIFTIQGIYNFNVIVTSDSGCVTTYNATSVIYPSPVAYFLRNVACLNQLANFADQSSVSNQFSSNSITEWEWSFPPNNTSTDQNPNYNFETSGNTQVGLQVTTNHGCVSDTLISVYIEPIPNVGFDVTAISGCSPVCVALTADPEENLDISITNYQWQISNGTIVSGSQSTFNDCFYASNLAQLLDVSLTVESSNGCVNSLVATGLISIYPNAQANFSISPTQPNTLDNYIVVNNLSSVATSWSWNTSFDGNSSVENPIFDVPTVSVNNEILLIANNQYDCPDTFNVHFNVVDVNIIYVPNTFTPDGGTYNTIFIPVFSPDFLPNKYHFMIFNRWGELVFETFDPLAGWDGTYLGKVAQDGTYTWKVDYTTTINPEDKNLVGHVNLLR